MYNCYIPIQTLKITLLRNAKSTVPSELGLPVFMITYVCRHSRQYDTSFVRAFDLKFTLLSVADLGEGPGPPVILGEKRRND